MAAPSSRTQPLVPNGVLAMAMFIATEVMFFAALISALLVLRAQAVGWPPPDQPRLPVGFTAVNTLVLLASGWTVRRAGIALRAREAGFVRWVALTAGLGAAFLGLQGFEWVRLVGYGLTTRSSLYGGTFYTLVGAHGLHVLIAVVVMLLALRRATRGGYGEGGAAFEPIRMYWAFVVLVWPVLYLLVYF